MPEWKSWTLGSDDDVSFLVPTPEAPAAPTDAATPVGMEPDEVAVKWSTEIEPVTIKLTRSEERRVGKECRSRW